MGSEMCIRDRCKRDPRSFREAWCDTGAAPLKRDGTVRVRAHSRIAGASRAAQPGPGRRPGGASSRGAGRYSMALHLAASPSRSTLRDFASQLSTVCNRSHLCSLSFSLLPSEPAPAARASLRLVAILFYPPTFPWRACVFDRFDCVVDEGSTPLSA